MYILTQVIMTLQWCHEEQSTARLIPILVEFEVERRIVWQREELQRGGEWCKKEVTKRIVSVEEVSVN